MKKYILISLTSLMLFSCGESSSETTSDIDEASQTEVAEIVETPTKITDNETMPNDFDSIITDAITNDMVNEASNTGTPAIPLDEIYFRLYYQLKIVEVSYF